MSLKRKDRVLILKYKLSFEEEIEVGQIHHLGSSDLANHLIFFKQKLSSKNPQQINTFNDLFFGGKTSHMPSDNLETKTTELSDSENVISHKPWAKKLYKKIVIATHPDKVRNLGIDVLVEKLTNNYMLAAESYSNRSYHNLIMIAHDLDIEFEHGLIVKEIFPALQKSQGAIISTKRMLGYQWYHLDDDSKRESLKEYLMGLGFTFTDDEISRAIYHARRKNTRKTGTRPVKAERIRLK